ncbi:MAG: hypothetical protein ACI87W_001393 [Halieaceae bacterium]|jgi:hypothetical protein
MRNQRRRHLLRHRQHSIAVYTLALLALTGYATAYGKTVAPTDSALMLSQLMQWLPGDYGNQAFLLAGRSAAQAADQLIDESQKLTTYIRKVELPLLGEHVLYVEEYRGEGDENLERVRLYSLNLNEQSGSVQMLVTNPNDPQALIGARNNLSRVQTLESDDLTIDNEGCRLSFQARAGEHIVGQMRHQGCRFQSQWVDYEMQVAEGGHWVCYSRRQQSDDAITWQLVNNYPCIHMGRLQDEPPRPGGP